jgi:hypothetical protein
MTADEIIIVHNLNCCRLPMASWTKRFVRDVHSQSLNNPESELTDKQKEWIYRLVYTFRKQIPGTYKKCINNKFCRKIK